MLKYKIWDIPNKKWVKPPYCINQFGDVQVNGVIFNNSEDFETCEYTGMHDKIDKECYESDIVKEGNSIGVVRFVDGQFIIDWVQNKDFWSDTLKHHLPNAEIIGNEHDNPDLLASIIP